MVSIEKHKSSAAKVGGIYIFNEKDAHALAMSVPGMSFMPKH